MTAALYMLELTLCICSSGGENLLLSSGYEVVAHRDRSLRAHRSRLSGTLGRRWTWLGSDWVEGSSMAFHRVLLSFGNGPTTETKRRWRSIGVLFGVSSRGIRRCLGVRASRYLGLSLVLAAAVFVIGILGRVVFILLCVFVVLAIVLLNF